MVVQVVLDRPDADTSRCLGGLIRGLPPLLGLGQYFPPDLFLPQLRLVVDLGSAAGHCVEHSVEWSGSCQGRRGRSGREGSVMAAG